MMDIITYTLFALYLVISFAMISGWFLLAWRPGRRARIALPTGEGPPKR